MLAARWSCLALGFLWPFQFLFILRKHTETTTRFPRRCSAAVTMAHGRQYGNITGGIYFYSRNTYLTGFSFLFLIEFVADRISVAGNEGGDFIPVDVLQSLNESLEFNCLYKAHLEQQHEVLYSRIFMFDFFLLNFRFTSVLLSIREHVSAYIANNHLYYIESIFVFEAARRWHTLPDIVRYHFMLAEIVTRNNSLFTMPCWIQRSSLWRHE